MRGTEVDHLCFTEINTTEQGMEVVVSYPSSFTNRIDLFSLDGGTGLYGFWWTLRETTNINSGTNYIVWTDTETNATDGIRFYAVANADLTAETDADGDGIPLGREHYRDHTDPWDPDTDDDGLSDGWEVQNGTDPLDTDSDDDGLWDGWEWQNFGHFSNSPSVTVTSTIQTAIDTAMHDDIVLVPAGTWTGTGNRNLDTGGKRLTLISESGPSTTTIDCQDSGRGFCFHTGESNNTLITGFTITGGNTNQGGGIYCSTSSPAILHCVISNNAAGDGGGIYCLESAPLIRDCSILVNSATNDGGGIYLRGSSPTIQDSLIQGNTGDSTSGGGLYCDSHYYIYQLFPR